MKQHLAARSRERQVTQLVQDHEIGACYWLRLARIDYGPVFRRVTAAGTLEGRLTGNGVWRRIRTRAEQAGVQAPEGERLSPHGLRAGFICEAYLNGALDEQVMAHARQTNIATTRRYRARAKVVQASPTKLLDL